MPEIVFLAVILLLGLAAFYSMVTYPKQREFQKRQKYVRTLNVGDEVLTYGGLIGKVVDIEPDRGVAHIEIASGVVVRFVTDALMQAYDPDEIARNARMGMGEQPER